MSVRTPSNLFIDSSLILHGGFYQRILRQASNFKGLGDRLVHVAEYEQAFRRYDKVNEIAQILINLPLKEYQTIGQYYLGLCKYKKGIDPIETFEHVAENASIKYRILAMHSLAAIATRRGDYDAKLSWLVESLKVAPSIQAFRGIAILKAIEGNHKAAVTDFEKYLPLTRYVEPLVYYDFLNSYAVELGEIGRVTEAHNIACTVLASPFVFAYPEWQQTAADLQTPSRSMVQVSGASNVLSMSPTTEHVVESPPTEPAKVFSLVEWKEKMVKEQNNEPDENVDELEKSDLIVRLLELTTKDDMNEEKLRKILKYSYKVMTGK